MNKYKPILLIISVLLTSCSTKESAESPEIKKRSFDQIQKQILSDMGFPEIIFYIGKFQKDHDRYPENPEEVISYLNTSSNKYPYSMGDLDDFTFMSGSNGTFIVSCPDSIVSWTPDENFIELSIKKKKPNQQVEPIATTPVESDNL